MSISIALKARSHIFRILFAYPKGLPGYAKGMPTLCEGYAKGMPVYFSLDFSIDKKLAVFHSLPGDYLKG